MFCRKGAIKYKQFDIEGNDKIKKIEPKTLECEKKDIDFNPSLNIIEFSITKGKNPKNNSEDLSAITEARIKYRFNHAMHKLNMLITQGE